MRRVWQRRAGAASLGGAASLARGARGRWRVATLLLATALGAVSLAGCSVGARDTGTHVVAGGASTGIYYSYGGAIADQLAQEGFDITVAATGGSVDNLFRVGRGEATLGFAQADAAADAIAGVGAFDEPLPVEGVARVYDEYVQVVVPADSPAVEIPDLAGLRVSVGELHSGVTVIADRVLRAAGVAEGDFVSARLGIDDSVDALARGEIDAFFWVGGIPTPGIDALSETTPVKILPISPETVEKVNSGHAGVYRLADFPLGIYGTDVAVETMTVPNYLITSADADPRIVFEMTRALFESRTEIADTVPAAALLDRRQAIFTGPVPLHEGAANYYVRSRK
ncbi:TAXI family TRAP transporter solute-binding subunit [Leucobacter albus]|uniref:TAXI family TRAP transporter solute-binding subunit n=1 Tax=Leucobacter albus TaxID=272210 RepID=A0ABW3TQH9_9MICO